MATVLLCLALEHEKFLQMGVVSKLLAIQKVVHNIQTRLPEIICENNDWSESRVEVLIVMVYVMRRSLLVLQ